MEYSIIPPSRALARRLSTEYEERFFWAFLGVFGRLEMETGLPWMRGFQTALFRVTMTMAKQERDLEVHDLDRLTRYLPWMWAMVSFGVRAEYPEDPAFAARVLAGAAMERVEQKLTHITKVEDIDLVLAAEIAAGWRPYVERMRVLRQRLKEEIQGFIDWMDKHPTYTFFQEKRKPAKALVQIPYERDVMSAGTHQAFFFPKDRVEASIDQFSAWLAQFRTRVACLWVWFRLPLNVRGLPRKDPVGFSATADICLDENWLRTQLLLAGLGEPVWREAAPWDVERFLKALKIKTPAALTRAFWQRMAERRMKPMTPEQRALIEPKILQEARHVLVQVGYVARGRILHDAERVAMFVIMPQDQPEDDSFETALAEIDVAPKPQVTHRDAAEAWLKLCRSNDLSKKRSLTRVASALRRLSLDEQKMVAIVRMEEEELLEMKSLSSARRSTVEMPMIDLLMDTLIGNVVSSSDVWASEALTAVTGLIALSDQERRGQLVTCAEEEKRISYLKKAYQMMRDIHARQPFVHFSYVMQLFDIIHDLVVGMTDRLNLALQESRLIVFEGEVLHAHRDDLALSYFYAMMSGNLQTVQQKIDSLMTSFGRQKSWMVDDRYPEDEALFKKRLEQLAKEYLAHLKKPSSRKKT